MATDAPIDAVAALPLFRDVPRSEIAMLVRVGRWARVPRGGELCRQGETAEHALFVVEGRLKAWVREGTRERPVSDVWPGELVGEAALYASATHRTATLRAFEDSAALLLTRAGIEAMGGTAALAALQEHMLESMARRLRTTNHAIRRQWRAIQSHEDIARPGSIGIETAAEEEAAAMAAAQESLGEADMRVGTWDLLKRFLGELA